MKFNNVRLYVLGALAGGSIGLFVANLINAKLDYNEIPEEWGLEDPEVDITVLNEQMDHLQEQKEKRDFFDSVAKRVTTVIPIDYTQKFKEQGVKLNLKPELTELVTKTKEIEDAEPIMFVKTETELILENVNEGMPENMEIITREQFGALHATYDTTPLVYYAEDDALIDENSGGAISIENSKLELALQAFGLIESHDPNMVYVKDDAKLLLYKIRLIDSTVVKPNGSPKKKRTAVTDEEAE